jgi:hypothetical protein
VRTRGVVVDDIEAVIDALGQFRQGNDLADQLMLTLPVLTFDARFSASEGVEILQG